MKHTLAPEELEEVIPSDAEEILHHGHVPQGWSGAAWLDKALEWTVGAAILAELVVILLNIAVRVITGDSVLWTQEVSEIALLTIAFIGGAIAIGALVGAFVYKVGGVPLTLSTSGGALMAGLFFGWLRSVRPTFGRIPSPTVWFMNSVGLNVFIAIVGLSSGPKFVAGLQQLGFSLFLWGVFATTLPIILAMYVGKYLFRFDDAIVLGCVSGARTTTASLGMVNDIAKSQIPGLGYTVTYAVGNVLLTTWGMILVMLLT